APPPPPPALVVAEPSVASAPLASAEAPPALSPAVTFPATPVVEILAEAPSAPTEAPAPAPQPAAPPEPPTPRIGDKVGFIQLPTKAAARTPEKASAVKLPPRPAPRPDFGRGRTEGRAGPRATQPATPTGRQVTPAARSGLAPAPLPARPISAPSEPAFVPP